MGGSDDENVVARCRSRKSETESEKKLKKIKK